MLISSNSFSIPFDEPIAYPVTPDEDVAERIRRNRDPHVCIVVLLENVHRRPRAGATCALTNNPLLITVSLCAISGDEDIAKGVGRDRVRMTGTACGDLIVVD